MRIDDRIDAIGRHPFRARFRLRGRERAIVQLRGMRDPGEQAYAVDVICRWIERQLEATG